MFISCNCLNIVLKFPQTDQLDWLDLASYNLNQQEPETGVTTKAKAKTPSDDHFLFFEKALGPVQCANVQVQFDMLVQKVRIFCEWDLSQCLNCGNVVYARHMVDDANADATTSAMNTCLVNSSLITNEEQLSARMAGDNYSPAFGIVMNGSNLNCSDLAEKAKLFSKATSNNKLMQQIVRDYMERQTEAANERIQRFTEQEFAVLKAKRERAEQDCMILAKLAVAYNQVPIDLLLVGSTNTSSNNNNGGQQTVAMTTADLVPNNNGTNLNDSSANSQLETPPPTPEYLPMSTGNSPPMTTTKGSTTNNRQQPITPSSSSSMVDQSQFSSSSNSRLNGRDPNKVDLSYNNANNNINNNNNIASYNNSRGAINRQQPQQPTKAITQHSSTNSLTMQQQHEADCMFDIDGMENDNSPFSNSLSDEEEFGFDESIGNNNENGMYIPSRQLGRQNGSIARSLPISIPQEMTQFRTNEEDFEELNEDNVDIAASIKALARSVHGDMVFGDLPRPQIQRFNTQI